MIDTRLPLIRIEQLLLKWTNGRISAAISPLSKGTRADHPSFYRTLIAACSLKPPISRGLHECQRAGSHRRHARRVLHDYIREDTLTAANAAIVNHHHALRFERAAWHRHLSPRMPNALGSGPAVSWPPITPDYGYYEKAIGIYTHISAKTRLQHASDFV